MCLCERRRQPQRYSLFNFISFLPRSTNRNMYDTATPACILYRQLTVQTTIYQLWFSIFVLQSHSRESTKAQSPKTEPPEHWKNLFCCCSWFLRSPDCRGLKHLCYQCYTTWLLFISLFFLFPPQRMAPSLS